MKPLTTIGLVVAATFLLAGCGPNQTVTVTANSPAGAAGSSSPTADPTASWTPISVSEGGYSFRYPSTLAPAMTCHATVDIEQAVAGNQPVSCGSSEAEMLMYFDSAAGDQTSGLGANTGQFPSEYVGPLKTPASVTVGGVQGSRYDITIPSDGMSVTKGEKQTMYAFFNGTRTYVAVYSAIAGAPDLGATFKQMVEQTLKFTS